MRSPEWQQGSSGDAAAPRQTSQHSVTQTRTQRRDGSSRRMPASSASWESRNALVRVRVSSAVARDVKSDLRRVLAGEREGLDEACVMAGAGGSSQGIEVVASFPATPCGQNPGSVAVRRQWYSGVVLEEDGGG